MNWWTVALAVLGMWIFTFSLVFLVLWLEIREDEKVNQTAYREIKRHMERR